MVIGNICSLPDLHVLGALSSSMFKRFVLGCPRGSLYVRCSPYHFCPCNKVGRYMCDNHMMHMLVSQPKDSNDGWLKASRLALPRDIERRACVTKKRETKGNTKFIYSLRFDN